MGSDPKLRQSIDRAAKHESTHKGGSARDPVVIGEADASYVDENDHNGKRHLFTHARSNMFRLGGNEEHERRARFHSTFFFQNAEFSQRILRLVEIAKQCEVSLAYVKELISSGTLPQHDRQ